MRDLWLTQLQSNHTIKPWPLVQKLLDGEVGPQALCVIPKDVVIVWVNHAPVQCSAQALRIEVVLCLRWREATMKCVWELLPKDKLLYQFDPPYALSVDLHQEVV